MPRKMKSHELEEIGQRIREARERLGLTQGQLAQRIGRTQDTISSYEIGDRAIRITELPKLAQALDVPVGFFFGYSTPEGEAIDLISELHSLSPEKQKKVVERWRFELNWWQSHE